MSDKLRRSSAPVDESVRYYSVAEAARKLGISKKGAYKLLDEHRFPTHAFKAGKVWRIPAQPVDDLIAGRAS